MYGCLRGARADDDVCGSCWRKVAAYAGDESRRDLKPVVSTTGREVQPGLHGLLRWCGYIGWVEDDEVEAFIWSKYREEIAVADCEGSGEAGSVSFLVSPAVVYRVRVDVAGDDAGSVSCAGERDDAAARPQVEDGYAWPSVYRLKEEERVLCGIVDIGVDFDVEILIVEDCRLRRRMHGREVVVGIFKHCL